MTSGDVLANDEARFSRIDADLLLLKCMTGATLAGVAGLLWKTFFA